MKVTSAVIISGATLLVGYFLNQPYLWVPLTILIAGIIESQTRRWVASDRLGRSVALSVLLKFIFATIGFYSIIGQIICVGLIIWWLIF